MANRIMFEVFANTPGLSLHAAQVTRGGFDHL